MDFHLFATCVAFIISVYVLALYLNYKKDQKDRSEKSSVLSDENNVALEQEGFQKVQPLNRKERRAIQFGHAQTNDEIKERIQTMQSGAWNTFSREIDEIVYDSNLSFNNAVEAFISIARKYIYTYRNRSNQFHRIQEHITDHDVLVMQHLMNSISYYAERCRVTDTSCVAMNVTKFVEEIFRIKGLVGVLYRNKGTHSSSQRYLAMMTAFQVYFKEYEVHKDIWSTPADELHHEQYVSNDEFRRDFYDNAIDGTYYDCMEKYSKEITAKQEKQRNAAHEHNRKQRRRRVLNSPKRKR